VILAMDQSSDVLSMIAAWDHCLDQFGNRWTHRGQRRPGNDMEMLFGAG
jgi:hypothetical protein